MKGIKKRKAAILNKASRVKFKVCQACQTSAGAKPSYIKLIYSCMSVSDRCSGVWKAGQAVKTAF